MSNGSFQLRDYQIDTLVSVFHEFGIEPAGPADNEVVSACRGNWTGQDGDDGGAGETLAGGQGDDVVAPF